MLPLEELIAFYYLQWSMFTSLPVNLSTTLSIVTRELDRETNIYVNQILERDCKIETIAEIGLDDLVKGNSRVLEHLRKKIDK